MFEILLIVASLALLMFLAYKGMSILWIAPVCAVILGLLSGLPLITKGDDTGILTMFGNGFGGFAGKYMLLFALGAMFGKLMEVTGAAKSVGKFIVDKMGAKRAIIAVVLSNGILCYGGVNLFVVVFATYPLAVSLFREANITRRLIPASIALGAFTFSMTALPGTPQIQNIIPIEYFGTDAMAAPIIGIVAAIIMFAGGCLYLVKAEKKYTAQGIVFTEPKNQTEEDNDQKLPNIVVSTIPLLIVLLTLNILKIDVTIALFLGVLFLIAMMFKDGSYKKIVPTLNEGAKGSIIALANTSAAVGFGSLVKGVPGFEKLTDLLLGMEGGVLLSEAAAVTTLAGATGSASGGMGIALAALGEQYLALATEAGISPEALHRVASIACGGLDSLPHNGAVLTLLAIAGLTHKESYKELFVVTALIPLFATIVAIVMGTVGIV